MKGRGCNVTCLKCAISVSCMVGFILVIAGNRIATGYIYIAKDQAPWS